MMYSDGKRMITGGLPLSACRSLGRSTLLKVNVHCESWVRMPSSNLRSDGSFHASRTYKTRNLFVCNDSGRGVELARLSRIEVGGKPTFSKASVTRRLGCGFPLAEEV